MNIDPNILFQWFSGIAGGGLLLAFGWMFYRISKNFSKEKQYIQEYSDSTKMNQVAELYETHKAAIIKKEEKDLDKIYIGPDVKKDFERIYLKSIDKKKSASIVFMNGYFKILFGSTSKKYKSKEVSLLQNIIKTMQERLELIKENK